MLLFSPYACEAHSSSSWLAALQAQLSRATSSSNDLIPRPPLDKHVFANIKDDVGPVSLLDDA
jgi:hypothetical protein